MRLALGTLACALVASGGGGDRSTIPSPHAQSVYEWVKHKSASRETENAVAAAFANPGWDATLLLSPSSTCPNAHVLRNLALARARTGSGVAVMACGRA